MGFFNDISLKKSWADTQTYFFGDKGINWRIAGVSLACTACFIGVFAVQSGFEKAYQPPKVTWVNSVDPNITKEEIVEQNRRMAAWRNYYDELADYNANVVRQRYCAIGKATGIDDEKCDEPVGEKPEKPPFPIPDQNAWLWQKSDAVKGIVENNGEQPFTGDQIVSEEKTSEKPADNEAQ